MNYKNDTFLFLLQEVSLKYHKIASKYHKSSINAEQMQHNAEQKYHYKYQRINVKQLTHDVAQKPLRCCPETVPNFGHSMPAVTGNRCPIHGLSMPITWSLSAHQMGIDRPTNGLISKRYQLTSNDINMTISDFS